MNIAWAVLLCFSLVCALAAGQGDMLLVWLSESAADAMELLLVLAGSYAVFGGVMQVLAEGGALRLLTRLLHKPLTFLFAKEGRDAQARTQIAANFAANMLGLSGAAVPSGLSAMGHMRSLAGGFCFDMGMFLVINCSSLQLFPTTCVALRLAAGSSNGADIFLPALLTSAGTTLFSVCLALLVRRGRRA